MNKREKEYLQNVGKSIKKRRLLNNIKQFELARACGFEKQNMQRIEAGKNNLTLKSLMKIAEALNVTVVDLLTF